MLPLFYLFSFFVFSSEKKNMCCKGLCLKRKLHKFYQRVEIQHFKFYQRLEEQHFQELFMLCEFVSFRVTIKNLLQTVWATFCDRKENDLIYFVFFNLHRVAKRGISLLAFRSNRNS